MWGTDVKLALIQSTLSRRLEKNMDVKNVANDKNQNIYGKMARKIMKLFAT